MRYMFNLFAVLPFLILANLAVAVQLDLDGDTDRTGRIEGSPEEENAEQNNSVILLNNCDRDNPSTATSEPDNRDTVINGTEDLKDVEPLILRKAAIAGPVVLRITKLSNDDLPLDGRVRVFSSNGQEIIGPKTGTEYQLSQADLANLALNDLTFYAEGLDFATSIKLSVLHGGNTKDSLKLEVAPLLLTPHNLKPIKNYVVLHEGWRHSEKFVDEFKQACRTAGVSPVVIKSNDSWMEDELTWAYTETPRTRLIVAFQMLRLRSLQLQTQVRKLLDKDVGWYQAFAYPQSSTEDLSLTYGGNVEVSPPTARYPFGRVYYGSIVISGNNYENRKFDARFKKFFERNSIQAPIELHTNWLAVGHIDEVVSFVPDYAAGGNKVLISSPKLAYDILGRLNRNTQLDGRYDLEFGLFIVGDFFTVPFGQQTLKAYNMEIDRRIFGTNHRMADPNSIKGRLKAALGLQESDFVEVPTVFFNARKGNVLNALALTPGVVNLSSMGEYSLLPRPFLPEFKTATDTALRNLGQKPLWINNWKVYHARSGEVHCGTQELRQSFSKKWWSP